MKSRWSIWISPKKSIGSRISTYLLSCGPPDWKISFAGQSATCIVPSVLRCRWTRSSRAHFRFHGKFVRIARFRPYFMIWCWSPSFAGWGTGSAVRTYVESLSLMALELVFLFTLMMYSFLCQAAIILRWYGRRLNDTKRSRGGGARLIATSHPAYG